MRCRPGRACLDVCPWLVKLGERVSQFKTHMAAPSHPLVLREGPKPTRPRGRIPRVARLLALAHHFEELLDTGAVETQAEFAELAKLTPARVTQS